MGRTLALICVAGVLAAACESGHVATPTPRSVSPVAGTPTALPRVLLVYTTWVADGKVTNGPEPGYRPAMTGLTSRDIQAASVVTDGTGTVWLLRVTFTERGAALFATLTRNNVRACPGGSVCAQRHLGVWLGLTQNDIDKWDNEAYAGEVSLPFSLPCLAGANGPTAVCPKFISDPVTLDEIDGGMAEISGAFTEATAREVANIINTAPAA